MHLATILESADALLTEALRKRRSRKAKFQATLRQLDKTQVEVAERTNRHESTISRYKTGTREPSIDALRRMAKQGIDVESVFDIRTGENQDGRRTGLRSKAHSSKVSDAMRKASIVAQQENRFAEPH